MGWKHYRQLTPKREPQVGGGTVWCPSTNSSLQISIFQIQQIFNILWEKAGPLVRKGNTGQVIEGEGSVCLVSSNLSDRKR